MGKETEVEVTSVTLDYVDEDGYEGNGSAASADDGILPATPPLSGRADKEDSVTERGLCLSTQPPFFARRSNPPISFRSDTARRAGCAGD